MRVPEGHGRALVPKQLLNRSERYAGHCQTARERVPQAVPGEARDARLGQRGHKLAVVEILSIERGLARCAREHPRALEARGQGAEDLPWPGCWIVPLLLQAGCAPQLIADPDLQHVRQEEIVEVAREGIDIHAVVLGQADATRLLHLKQRTLAIVPILFRVTNLTETSLLLDGDTFRLGIGPEIELSPAPPGRAASLLRDTRGATWMARLGLLVGAGSAIGIHLAEARTAWHKR